MVNKKQTPFGVCFYAQKLPTANPSPPRGGHPVRVLPARSRLSEIHRISSLHRRFNRFGKPCSARLSLTVRNGRIASLPLTLLHGERGFRLITVPTKLPTVNPSLPRGGHPVRVLPARSRLSEVHRISSFHRRSPPSQRCAPPEPLQT